MKLRSEYFYKSIILTLWLSFPLAAAAQVDTLDVDATPKDTLYVDSAVVDVPTDTTAIDATPAASDTIAQAAPKAPAKPPRLNGLGLHVDYLKILGGYITDSKKYEGGVTLTLFKRIALAAEAGYGKLQPQKAIKNGHYISEGNYWRAGVDVMLVNTAENKIFLGARFAQSSFDDRGAYRLENSLFEPYEDDFERTDLTAAWYEILLGAEGQLFWNFYAGWTARYRSISEKPELSPISVYNIPGYGVANKMSVGFNLYLRYLVAW